MTSMEQGRRMRRSFTEQHKAEVVALCRSGEKSMAEVARDLGLTESSVRRWASQAEIDAGQRGPDHERARGARPPAPREPGAARGA